jgi:ribokinase
MAGLVVFGSVAFDSIKTPFGSVEKTLGGSGAYASIAASFFAKPGIVSAVGSDFPTEEMDFLKKKGIDLEGLELLQGKTFYWKGEYGHDINSAKTIDVQFNVLKGFRPKLPEEYRKADFLLLGNNDPEDQLAVLGQMEKRPTLVIADTMNYYIEHKRDKVLEVVKKSDICLMNDGEARMLFNTPSLVKAAKEILKLDSKLAIIKKGEHGALLATEKGSFVAPAYPLEEVMDPTGCGDCFAGALMGFLASQGKVSEELMRKAIIYGSTVASFNAEGMGMERLRTLTRKEIDKRFEEFRELARF